MDGKIGGFFDNRCSLLGSEVVTARSLFSQAAALHQAHSSPRSFNIQPSPFFCGFGFPGFSCLIENMPVSNLWFQAVGRQCAFCSDGRIQTSCVLVTGVRRRVRRVCWRPGMFVVSQHVWSPQWRVSPTCLRWHVCGQPACLEPASARFSDMFAMSNGSLKRDWRELTARVQNGRDCSSTALG